MPWHGVLKLHVARPADGDRRSSCSRTAARYLQLQQTGQPVADAGRRSSRSCASPCGGAISRSLAALVRHDRLMRKTALAASSARAHREPVDRKTARRRSAARRRSPDHLLPGAPPVQRAAGEPRPWGAPRAAAAILILLGLLPALYTSRRKVWVRAEPNGSGARAEGGRVRAAAQAAVRRRVREAGGRHGDEPRRRPAGRRRRERVELAVTDLQWARSVATTRSTWRCSPTSRRWSATSRTWRSGAMRSGRSPRGRAFVGLGANVAGRRSAAAFAAHRVPWGNMYEYSILLAAPRRGRIPVHRGGRLQGPDARRVRPDVRRVHDGDRRVRSSTWTPRPLVPALNSYWIKIHVVAAITGSSLFALGGGVAHDPVPGPGPRERSRWTRSARRRRRRSWVGRSTSMRHLTSRRRRRRARRPGRRAGRDGLPPTRGDARPDGLPGDRVRVPDLDVRGDRRRDLGAEGVGPLLGMGPEGDVVVHHVDDLRRLPARALDVRLEGAARRRGSRSSGSYRC